jgi:hypothetical protein
VGRKESRFSHAGLMAKRFRRSGGKTTGISHVVQKTEGFRHEGRKTRRGQKDNLKHDGGETKDFIHGRRMTVCHRGQSDMRM